MLLRPAPATRALRGILPLVLMISAACSTDNGTQSTDASVLDTSGDAEDIDEVFLIPTFDPTLEADVTTGNVPLTVKFTFEPNADVDASEFFYTWEFGDGDVVEVNPDSQPELVGGMEHTFKYKGLFPTRVTMTWKRNLKLSKTVTKEIEVVQPADLSLSTIALLGSSELKPGQKIRLTLDVQNDGAAVEAPFKVAVLLSQDDTADDKDLVAGTIELPGIGSGLEGTAKISYTEKAPLEVTIPAGIGDGNWFVIVDVDPAGVVPEVNKLDNEGYATTLIQIDTTVVEPADLQITAPAFDGAGTYNVGATATYTLDLKNVAKGEAKNFKFAVYLSKDQTLQVDPSGKKGVGDIEKFDILITDPANSTVKSLAGGATLPVFRGLSVPDVPDGAYFLISSIDIGDDVSELDETNNVAVSTSTLTVKKEIIQGVDVALLSMVVKPKGTYLGGTIGVSWHVKNIGTEPSPKFPATLYFCPTAALSKAQCVINQTSFEIDPLAVGEEKTGVTTVTVNTKTPVQNWYLFLLIDPNNTISELDEGNNVQKWDNPPLKVSATAQVELKPESVGYHPAKVEAGDEIKVSHKIINSGSTGSGATTTYYVLSTVPEINLANVSNGKNIVVKKVIDAGVEGLDQAQRVETIVIPKGLDHLLSKFYLGVFLDAENAEKTDNKANNGASSAVQLEVNNTAGGCYDDAYDKAPATNNTSDKATVLEPGTYDKLGSCANEDWYAVELNKGDSLVVKLFAEEILWTSPIPGDLDLEISDPNGVLLDAQKSLGLAKQAVALTVKSAGAYKIRVSPNISGVLAHYALQVQVDPPPAGIDLFGSHLSASPAAAYPGGLVKAKLSLTNLGATAAGKFSIRYVLSADSKIEATDTVLKLVERKEGLGAAETVELLENIVLPVVGGGKYYLGVMVDVKNEVAETNETNNNTASNTVTLNSQIACATDAFSGNHTVGDAAPLEPKTATYDKLNICPGLEDWFKIELPKGMAFSVKVNWTQKAGAGLVGLQIVDGSGKGVVAGTANPFDPVAKIPYLQVGGTYYLHTYVLPLGSKPAEPYDYGLEVTIADPDPSDVCLADVYESNNAADSAVELGCGIASNTLCIGDEDWFYLDLEKDESIKIIFDHQGSGFEFAIYDNPKLAALQKVGDVGTIDFTAKEKGTYHMRASYKVAGAKPGGTFAYTLTVDGGKGIDLLPKIKSIFPNSVVQGEDAYLTTTLSNACKDASPDFHYGWYFSTDDKFDAGDPLMLEKAQKGLGAKAAVDVDDKVPVPTEAKPGPAWLFLKIDNQDEVVESQELNNTASQTMTVVKLCLPDALEPNNTPTLAQPLEIGKVEDLAVCPYELDWYKITVEKDEYLTVTANFVHEDGDLDLRLYKPGKFGSAVASAATKKAPEQLVYKAPEAGTLYLRVGGFTGDTNVYSLQVCKSMTGACVDCPSDLYCPEGSFCAEGGVCKELGCTIGKDETCDDGNGCTKDACVAGKGCENTPVAEETPCSDGDACTLGEACDAAGACKSPAFTSLQQAFGEGGTRGGDMVVLDHDSTLYVGSALGKDGKGRVGTIWRNDGLKTSWGATIAPQGWGEVHLAGAVTRVTAGDVAVVGYVALPMASTAAMLPEASTATALAIPEMWTETTAYFAHVDGQTGAVLHGVAFTGMDAGKSGLRDVIASGSGFVAVGHAAAAKGADGIDAWIVGLDVKGGKTWELRIGGAGDDAFHAVAPLPGGGWVAVGQDSDGKGKQHGLVALIGADGKLGWSKTYSTVASWAALHDVAVEVDGRIVAVGATDELEVGGLAKLQPWLLMIAGAKLGAEGTATQKVTKIPGTGGFGLLNSIFVRADGLILGGAATGVDATLGLEGLIWRTDAAGAVKAAYSLGSTSKGSHDVVMRAGVWNDVTRGFGTAGAQSTVASAHYEMRIAPPKATCNDGNPCTVDACVAQTGCKNAAVADGTACGTGLTCQAGQCK
ncbi:MAG: hypothetical protein H6747_06245 [Deltaproteobacteria bacterium]|nr:hypothetical protein [Deltaproteobacteria bacterium]